MPNLLVFLVGEVRVENFVKDVSQLEESRKSCYRQLVQNVTVVEESIRMFVDQSKELDKTPPCGQDVDEIQSVPDQRASDYVEGKKDNQHLHFLHL